MEATGGSTTDSNVVDAVDRFEERWIRQVVSNMSPEDHQLFDRLFALPPAKYEEFVRRLCASFEEKYPSQEQS